jgi:pimeloyl-ACP methyl ester carboxylesterase
MSTQTRHASRLRHTPSPNQHSGRPRGAGGAIVASLAAGALAAAVLAFVVFPGGAEARITGSLLLGFGFGWALMVAWTGRRTSQPQRWAVVPAVAMGLPGLTLVVLNPGNQALTVLNWVWPPLTVALTVWMFVQVRRSVTGKARWVLVPVLAVLVLASVGAIFDNIARGEGPEYAAPGKLYDVGGHRLHLDCRGHGSPTVVLSNGLGGVSAGWARISGPVSATTRVCAYDRAGQGWSADAESPRDGIQSATELHELLAEAGEHGPYVLVGHSTGGTYAMTYTARYPEQVAGLVLLDSSSPEQFSRMPAFSGQYKTMMRPMYALMPTLSRLGIGQIPGTSNLPAPDAARVAAITSTPKYFRNQRDEVSVIPELFTQAQALTTLDDRPVAVLTASVTSTGTKGWVGAQDALTALSTSSVHRIVPSTHEGLLEDARAAAASVRAISEVIASVRTGTPLRSR